VSEERRSGPAVENRWWVDTGKARERPRAGRQPPPPVGSRFFDIGYDFNQEQAKTRLTDVNLRFLEEARPAADEWRTVHTVPGESVPAAQIERLKRRLALPPGARGVIVDSGRSVRFIVTGDPVGERILEFTFGGESSFDCWVRGEWVREERFRDLNHAIERAGPFLGRYLRTRPDA
jgi:hypothetical protein